MVASTCFRSGVVKVQEIIIIIVAETAKVRNVGKVYGGKHVGAAYAGRGKFGEGEFWNSTIIIPVT
jgi:hypothetical protein